MTQDNLEIALLKKKLELGLVIAHQGQTLSGTRKPRLIEREIKLATEEIPKIAISLAARTAYGNRAKEEI
jgi:hypothetical protein